MWAFVVNFCIPYMLGPLSFRVGWIFGSTALLGAVYYFCFLPETKGKALEEIDAIFEVPFNPFRQDRIYQNAAQTRVGIAEGEYPRLDASMGHDDKDGEIEAIEDDRASRTSRV